MTRRLFVLACAGIMLAAAASAQETINTASVSGRVTDQQGAVVPGAAVVARQTQTNVMATATTDQEGRFRFPFLKLGPYEVTVRLQGFANATRTLTLGIGAAYELPITLSIAGVASAVTVEAEAAALETARTQIAATIGQLEVEQLPMNGRNFVDLALLVPGVSPTNTASNQLFPETSAVPGQGISIGSQRNLSNNFIVDGLSANDDAAALAGIPYGVDAVDQFQVVTSGGQAELGRALGGYVSIVTKSGTNMFQGSLYGYVRDDSLNASNALLRRTLPMNQRQYGVSAGGPLRRDRTFYFSNVEQRTLNQTGLITIAPESVAAVNARLSQIGYRGAALATGLYPNPVDSTTVLGKIDHQMSAADQIGVRYALYHVGADKSRGAGALNAASASAGLDNIDQNLALSNTHVLGGRTVNELRAQVARGDLKAPPSDPIGPAASIAGAATFGTLSGSPTGRVNTMYQVVDNLAHQTGGHAVKTGIDVLFNHDTIEFPRSRRGAYTFSSLPNFLSGVYNNLGFTQTFGTTAVSQWNPNIGMYVQDEWKVTPGVTVNAGLRYDLQFLDTIATDVNNLSPRIGIAWTPSPSSRMIVRGGAGVFYDRIPLRAVANAVLSAGNTTDLNQLRQINVSLSPTQTGAPLFPAILDAPIPLVTLVNVTTMDGHIQNAYSRQANVEIERQIGSGATVSVGYQYLRGLGLIASVNQNVPTCVASGDNNGCRPNSTYANNSQYSSVGHSSYHGLHVSLVRRPAGWGNYRVSYTLSKSMNDVGENFFSSPIDPFDISKDWGRSDDDQRHRLVASGAVQARGVQLSGMLQSYSALPLNITSGVTTIQGTAGRPIVNGSFIARNAGVGSDFFTVNLSVSRTFPIHARLRVEGLIEGFNITNRTNVVTRNANFGGGAYPGSPSSTFNQTTAVADPRTAQVGVRLTF